MSALQSAIRNSQSAVGMKRCYLVRHAQTSWNEENRIQGHSDLPLSSLGERQARLLGTRFASQHVHGIFTSALRRSVQTAQLIAEGLPAASPSPSPAAAEAGNGRGLSLIVVPELGEMHLGDWEGLTPDEVDARFSNAYQQWRRSPSSVVIPGAEPLDAFRTRVRSALDRVMGAVGEGEYVVVSHGGVIAAVLADLLAADYDAVIRRMRLDNGGITAVEYGAHTPHALWINATQHLAPLAQPQGAGWF